MSRPGRWSVARVLALALSSACGFLAVAKLVWYLPPHPSRPLDLWIGLGIVSELTIAIIIISRRTVSGGLLATLFFAGVVAYRLIGARGACHCAGAIDMSQREALMVALTLGFCSSLLVYLELSRVSVETGKGIHERTGHRARMPRR